MEPRTLAFLRTSRRARAGLERLAFALGGPRETVRATPVEAGRDCVKEWP
jgi:hypothetical protein